MADKHLGAEFPRNYPVFGRIHSRVYSFMRQPRIVDGVEDTDRNWPYHCFEHASQQVAHVASEIAKLIDRNSAYWAWAGGMYHDIEQIQLIVPIADRPPLLGRERKPTSGLPEIISGEKAFDHLIELGVDETEAVMTQDSVIATIYEFIEGDDGSILIHPLIKEASNPRIAFAVAMADVLNVLTLRTTNEMLDQTLRFFLEKYPDLTEFVRKPDQVLLPDTYSELLVLLEKFSAEEIRFMRNQFRQLIEVALDISLSPEEISGIQQMLDLGKFNDAHNFDDWNSGWLSSPGLLAGRLHTALPHELKITENNPSRVTRPSRRRIRLPFGIFS